MKITVEREPENIAKIDISIDADLVAKEYQKTCKAMAQRVNIDGFRKGKAPLNIVEQHVGVSTIQHSVVENLFPTAFYQAVNEQKLEVIAQPYVESFVFNNGEDLKIVAKVELKPEVVLPEYKNLEIKYDEFKTSPDALDKEIESLQNRFAELKDITEDRNALASDITVIDFEGYVDGNLLEGGSAKNHTLDLAHSNFIPGFAEQIIGHKKGEEFDINVTFPDEYHNKDLNGKPAVFKIKLNAIKERVLPELTPEFVAKVGKYKDIDDLKQDITKYLEVAEKTENDKRKANAVFDKILAETKVDIQSSMINREVESLMNELKERIKAQGGDWNQMLEAEGSEKIYADVKNEAISRIKNTLVIAEVSKLEKVEVKADDINMKLEQMAQMYGTDKKTLLTQLKGNNAVLNNISQQLIGEKVTKFLLDNNNFVVNKQK